MSNILRRKGSAFYYVRLRVPEEIREESGKNDRWQSLRTSDIREAKLRAAPIVARWRQDDDLRLQKRALTDDDLKAAAWAHYTRELDLDAKGRVVFPETVPFEQWSREMQAKTLRKHLATGETALIEWAADDFVAREKLLIERGSTEYKQLCQRLQRAQLEALERAAERDRGDFAGVPRDQTVAPRRPGATPQRAAPGEEIMDLFDRFKVEKLASVKGDTWDQNRRAVSIFAEFIGAGSHISAITRKAVRDWKQHLLKYPARATDPKMAAFAGMSFREAIEANATLKKPTLSNKTVNRYLSALGKFCAWLLQNEYLDVDPVTGQLLEIDKRKRRVGSYTLDQLASIFGSPLFASCGGDRREHIAGNVKVRDWRFWLPIVAAYSGARLGEIAQLLVNDLRQAHGDWIFHVTPEFGDPDSDEKSVKTEGSARVVPVHAKLIELGSGPIKKLA